MIAEQLTVNDRPYNAPKIDIGSAPFWCFPGRAIFATPKHDEQITRESGLILPHKHATIRRLPVATCVRASWEIEAAPGNDYIVHQAEAKRVCRVRVGDWSFSEKDGELWLFGCVSPLKGEAITSAPKWLLAELVDRGGVNEQDDVCPFPVRDVDTDLRAHDATTWRNGKQEVVGTCILSLPEPSTMRNGLHLIDRQREWPDMAVVVATSPSCQHARPGMVVWYQRAGLHGWGHLPEMNFASIHETAIFAAVNI